MNKEIKEILDNLQKIIDGEGYPEDYLSHDEVKILLDYITNLEQEIEQYENPEDMTLFIPT